MNEYNYNDWRNYLMHYNHNHDALGRFTTSGYAALTTKAERYKSQYQKQKIRADKASAKAGKTYRKLSKYDNKRLANPRAQDTPYTKKGHKLENKYAKQKAKADKLTAKANKTYKNEVKYEKKAAKYLEQLEKERKEIVENNRLVENRTYAKMVAIGATNSPVLYFRQIDYKNKNLDVTTDNPSVCESVLKDLPKIDSKVKNTNFNNKMKEIESHYGKIDRLDLTGMSVRSRENKANFFYRDRKWDSRSKSIIVPYNIRNNKIGRIKFDD